MVSIKILREVEDELHQQYDVVRLHNWVNGQPEKFQSACLVVRNDSKRVIDFDKASDGEILEARANGWYEIDPKVGLRLFIIEESVELSRFAEDYVYGARAELGGKFLLKDEAAAIKKDGCVDPSYQNYDNIGWNDTKGYGTKARAEKVLALALKNVRADIAARSRKKVSK